jgi:hypothetical protein
MEPVTASTPNSSSHAGADVLSTRRFFTPSATSSRTRCEPRKPVPPVTSVTDGVLFASAALPVAATAALLVVFFTAAFRAAGFLVAIMKK